MDRLVVVKFHTNIANRWLFMIQEKYWLSFSIHKVILTCLGGGAFFRTRCMYMYRLIERRIKHSIDNFERNRELHNRSSMAAI